MKKQKREAVDVISMKLIDEPNEKVWVTKNEAGWLVQEKLMSGSPRTAATCDNLDDALYYVWTHYVKITANKDLQS
ncbi:hypothetical protein AB4090_05465 [Acidithiobacillus sp. IBUN Pt1247-S3]|uniref:hypothetical protein n=1 Tax=Acidithiobacillus sp. IBUN Pt1247-S3 TaxID=3166642 RepID=UPI0034E55D45